MKRWRVEHTPKGMVLGVTMSAVQLYVGDPPTPIRQMPDVDRFYCDAVDELGALAAFLQAWEQAK